VGGWGKVVNIDSLEDNISGVYCLYFIINPNEYRAYIGSSVNIKSRLKSHLRDLDNDNHESASLLKYYKEFSINMAIVEECDREIVLQREGFYLGRFS
jgi:excinuclease UvrABC nuclease subunit